MQKAIFAGVFYWLSTPVLVAVAGLLLWRKLWRQFAFFFCYIALELAIDAARKATFSKPKAYLYTYWITAVVAALFALLATCELFVKRIFPRFYEVGFYRYLFLVVGAILAGLAMLTVFGGLGFAVLANLFRTFDFLRAAVLVFFIALMLFMGRGWARYEFGIALGLGLDAAAFLVVFAIFTRSGPLHGVLRDLPVFAFDAASIIWLVTFLRPEKPTVVRAAPVRPEVLEQAREWERTLKDSLGGKKREP